MGTYAQSVIAQAWQSDHVGVSAITFWEVAMLQAKGRIRVREDLAAWRREQLEQGMKEIPVDGKIGIRAASLAQFHADPADRLIVATAMEGHILLTADHQILDWPGQLDCIRATQ